MSNREFAKRNQGNTNFIKLANHSEGDTLINGDRFMGVKEIKGPTGPFDTYLFESDEGEVSSISVTGQLRYKMEVEQEVQVGERVVILYGGKKQVKNYMVHQFEVMPEVVE